MSTLAKEGQMHCWRPHKKCKKLSVFHCLISEQIIAMAFKEWYARLFLNGKRWKSSPRRREDRWSSRSAGQKGTSINTYEDSTPKRVIRKRQKELKCCFWRKIWSNSYSNPLGYPDRFGNYIHKWSVKHGNYRIILYYCIIVFRMWAIWNSLTWVIMQLVLYIVREYRN